MNGHLFHRPWALAVAGSVLTFGLAGAALNFLGGSPLPPSEGHPNPAGHKELAGQIVPVIVELVAPAEKARKKTETP